MKIKGLLVEFNTIEEVECDFSLKGYYDLLDCRYIDMITRYIDGVPFILIIDDEARLNVLKEEDLEALGEDANGRLLENIKGSIFIVGMPNIGEDEERSLNAKEIELIKEKGWQYRTDFWHKKTGVLVYNFR